MLFSQIIHFFIVFGRSVFHVTMNSHRVPKIQSLGKIGAPQVIGIDSSKHIYTGYPASIYRLPADPEKL